MARIINPARNGRTLKLIGLIAKKNMDMTILIQTGILQSYTRTMK